MPKDHYLPASLIGRFSIESTSSARKRKVFVLHKGRRAAFRTKAENIGYVNGLYDLATADIWGNPVASVDLSITGYEAGLPQALDKLEQGKSVGMETWLRVLVPYVASLFVRTHEFEPRYLARPSVRAASRHLLPRSANYARLVEMERLLTPVCCARWVVMHISAGSAFVLNDLGLAGTIDAGTGAVGWILPIGQNTTLGIFPKRSHDVAVYRNGKWWALIEHLYRDPFDARPFNESIACCATSYVIGASQEIVERLAPLVGRYDHYVSNMMEAWPVSSRTRLAYSQEWYRLLTAIHGDPAPEAVGNLREIKPSVVVAGSWWPAVSIFLNVRDFPSGLTRNDGVITLTLTPSPDLELIQG